MEPEVILYNTDVDAGHVARKNSSFLCTTLILHSVTATNRELRQAYKTAEVRHSQLWAQPSVMLAYELLNRTGNGFNIKVFVLLNKSKPALAQTQVSKRNILATSKLSCISVIHFLGEPTTDLACWMLTCHQTLPGGAYHCLAVPVKSTFYG